MAIARDLAPRETISLLASAPRPIISRALTYFVALVPTIIAVGINSWFAQGAWLDSMPLQWWLRKFVIMLVVVGVAEESIWRLFLGGMVLRIVGSVEPSAAWLKWLVLWTTFLFFSAHVGARPTDLVMAALTGLTNAYVLFGRRDFTACILGHTVGSTILARWNS